MKPKKDKKKIAEQDKSFLYESKQRTDGITISEPKSYFYRLWSLECLILQADVVVVIGR